MKLYTFISYLCSFNMFLIRTTMFCFDKPFFQDPGYGLLVDNITHIITEDIEIFSHSIPISTNPNNAPTIFK